MTPKSEASGWELDDILVNFWRGGIAQPDIAQWLWSWQQSLLSTAFFVHRSPEDSSVKTHVRDVVFPSLGCAVHLKLLACSSSFPPVILLVIENSDLVCLDQAAKFVCSV
jgi:hypothetical protein